MIKPSDLPKNHDNSAAIAALETQWDAAINAAYAADKWPAYTGDSRDGAPLGLVEQVAKQYREAGWRVRQVKGKVGHYSVNLPLPLSKSAS